MSSDSYPDSPIGGVREFHPDPFIGGVCGVEPDPSIGGVYGVHSGSSAGAAFDVEDTLPRLAELGGRGGKLSENAERSQHSSGMEKTSTHHCELNWACRYPTARVARLERSR